MKKIISFSVLLLLLVFTSCKSRQAAEVKHGDCYVKVNFASAGAGIDNAVYGDIKNMISDKKVKFTEKNMGREGEREICMSLNELKASEQDAFITQLKKTAMKGQLVSVSVN